MDRGPGGRELRRGRHAYRGDAPSRALGTLHHARRPHRPLGGRDRRSSASRPRADRVPRDTVTDGSGTLCAWLRSLTSRAPPRPPTSCCPMARRYSRSSPAAPTPSRCCTCSPPGTLAAGSPLAVLHVNHLLRARRRRRRRDLRRRAVRRTRRHLPHRSASTSPPTRPTTPSTSRTPAAVFATASPRRSSTRCATPPEWRASQVASPSRTTVTTASRPS